MMSSEIDNIGFIRILKNERFEYEQEYMRKKWKKALAAVCIVSMLMTMLDLGVLADEMQEEELIVADAEVPEETVESLAEDDIDRIEARIEENNVNKIQLKRL